MRDRWVYSPFLDFVVGAVAATLAGVVLCLSGWSSTLDLRIGFAAGVAGLAGLAATAETFACGVMLSSDSRRMSRIRQEPANRTAIPANWVAVLGGAVLSAAVALVAMLFTEAAPTVSLAVVIGALALTAAGFYRAIHWLRFTWDQEFREAQVEHVTPPPSLPAPKTPFRKP